MIYPINVLMLSTDKKAFETGSEVRARLMSYAAGFSSLHVLVVGAKGEVVKEGNLIIEPVPVLFKIRIPWIVKNKIRKVLATETVHVVSAQDPFEVGLGAFWGVRGKKTPLHVQVHTDFLSPSFIAESHKNRVRVRIANRVFPAAAGIRVVSERIKNSLVARYGTGIPVPTVIPVVVPVIDAPAVPLPSHNFSFALFATSRLESEKHIGDILQALAYIRTYYPGTGLFIAGEGREKKKLMAFAKSLGLSDAVVWLGWRADARQLMQSAHAFIQASGYEGYGMTLIEAALAHVPIITTDVGIVGEVFRPGQDVLVSPTSSAADLAALIARLIEDNQLRIVLANAAVHTVRNHLASHIGQPERIAEDIARAAGIAV
jgi:glycosyltransferase involved in cell wall biosynthesis